MADTQLSVEEKIVKSIKSEAQQKTEKKHESEVKIVGEKEAYEKQKEEEEKINPDIDYRLDPLFYDVANYFGIDHDDYDFVKQKLSDIVDWAIDVSGSRKSGDILKTISTIERALRSPGMGERRYAIVHRYVRLDDSRKNLENKMDVYRKNIDTKPEV